MMRFHLPSLAVLTSFLLFITPSLTSPSDILYIQQLTADYSINIDTKNFKDLDIEFTANATLDPGDGVFVKGLPAIKTALAAILANNVTQSHITTSSISLLPRFDDVDGGASRASAIQYVIGNFLAKDPADAGKAFTLYGVFKDKFVKTKEFGDYGGWRFSQRVLQLLVSFFFSCFLYWVLWKKEKTKKKRKDFFFWQTHPPYRCWIQQLIVRYGVLICHIITGYEWRPQSGTGCIVREARKQASKHVHPFNC